MAQVRSLLAGGRMVELKPVPKPVAQNEPTPTESLTLAIAQEMQAQRADMRALITAMIGMREQLDSILTTVKPAPVIEPPYVVPEPELVPDLVPDLVVTPPIERGVRALSLAYSRKGGLVGKIDVAVLRDQNQFIKKFVLMAEGREDVGIDVRRGPDNLVVDLIIRVPGGEAKVIPVVRDNGHLKLRMTG